MYSSSNFKLLAKEALPPFLYRLAKRIGQKHSARSQSDKGVGISRRGPQSVILTDDTKLNHRDSDADRGVIDQIFVQQDYDLRRFKRYGEIQAFYEQSQQPLIIDCGANIGASVAWFSTTYPRANLIAVEPEKENFALLTSNCKSQRILLIQGALARRSGQIGLRDPGEGEWGYRAGGAAEGVELYTVPAFSVADLVAMRNGTPFILKIDIEGAESDLFDENDAVFDTFAVVIIELHDWMLPRSGSSKSFLKWHTRSNRDFVFHGENVFSISNDWLLAA